MKIEVLKEMIGRTFVTITGDVGSDEMIFTDSDGRWVRFYHSSDCCDCCESVDVADIIGDLSDLLDSPMVLAEVANSDEMPAPTYGSDDHKYESESYTWTFYRFGTVKGTVTVRWLGESNGYYSEGVAICTSEHSLAWDCVA